MNPKKKTGTIQSTATQSKYEPGALERLERAMTDEMRQEDRFPLPVCLGFWLSSRLGRPRLRLRHCHCTLGLVVLVFPPRYLWSVSSTCLRCLGADQRLADPN
jgi:hypothetical protein